MKNVQIIDGADNATYSIFQATDDEFLLIFPRPGQDLEIAEAVYRRLGPNRASSLFGPIWTRPVLKPNVNGIHGTLFYNYYEKRHHLPRSKREIDRDGGQINHHERALFQQARMAELLSEKRVTIDAETRLAVEAFLQRLVGRYSVQDAILYGSRARRDFRVDSDADLLVVLKGEKGDRSAATRDMASLAFDAMLDTGILVEPLPLWEGELEQPELFRNPALLRDIARDGLRL